MLKTKPIKGGNVTSDVRVHYMRLLRSASTTVTLNMLYPRMLAIHDLTDQIGFPGANGRLKLPRFMRASHEFMVAHGAYLLGRSFTGVQVQRLTRQSMAKWRCCGSARQSALRSSTTCTALRTSTSLTSAWCVIHASDGCPVLT